MRLLRSTCIPCCALILVAGCHHHRRDGFDMLSRRGYRYRVGSALVGPARDTLRVVVVVLNESKEMRGIAFGSCGMSGNELTARLTASGHSWKSDIPEKHPVVFHDSAGRVIEQVCLAVLHVMTFPPGHSTTYVLETPVRDILGDSLPNGRYHVTARLWDQRHLDAGEVTLLSPRN